MNSISENHLFHLLIIEDNPGDVRLTREAFGEGRIEKVIHSVNNGEEAMMFLLQKGKYAECPRPDLILLDLNLPRKDGRELLKEIKENNNLKRIPIIVLTTSASEADIDQAYRDYANCFITKPVNMYDFLRVTRAIELFWLSLVKLPDRQ